MFLDYYNTLLEESESLSEKSVGKQVWSSINRLSPDYANFIYFLILHDYLLHGGDEKSNPYGCKLQTGGRGVIFNVDKLPLRTKKILLLFLTRISK